MIVAPTQAAGDDAANGVRLRSRDLAVGYRRRRAQRLVLEHLDLCVHDGELVCLLGPNGIGKSTLLRTLARIQAPLGGAVEVGGIDLCQLGPEDLARRVGVVLTERVIVGALPASRVVELGRYPHLGWSGRLGARDRAVVQWAIEAVGAGHLAARDINELSDGERQRIMIARALAQEPQVLLLDEPTAFVDVPSRVELMGLLHHLARNEHVAIVASTHDLELALRLSDTVWLVAAGGRFFSGAPEDLVLAGHVAETFDAEGIHFSPEERAFRLALGGRGRAMVRGRGLRATLAAAVLERECYEVVGADGPVDLSVTIGAQDVGWEASGGGRAQKGDNFAALSAFVRSLHHEIGEREETVEARDTTGG